MRRPDRIAALVLLALTLVAMPGWAKEKVAPAKKHVSYIGQVNLRLATNYMREGDLELALEKGGHALRSDPQSSQVHTTLAMIHERIGDQSKAGKHYDRALSLEPGSGSVLNAHAVWLCRRGDRATADAEFNRALADPFYTQPKQALLNAGRCAMQGEDLGKADGYFRRVVQEHPKDRTALMALASIHLRMGDPLRARAFLQRREALGGLTAEVVSLAIEIESAVGDAAAAARYRQRLSEQFPEFTPPAREGPRQP